ncbi:MAG: EpsG family protein [Tannerellaceae bacterium]|jgi:hypothetical protein|nr:EpsG family protein [Tannerellaceae bacterium]
MLLPYYVFFGFFGIASILDYLKCEYEVYLLKRFCFLGGLILILFFVGLRYKLASDWMSYTVMYEYTPSIINIDFDSIVEPGFNILLSLFKTVGFSFELLVFCITLYNAISLFSFINRSQIDYKITFIAVALVLNVFREIDILRQSLALYTILYAFSNKKPNVLKNIMLLVVAISFHYTAIIFVVFYAVKQIKLTKNILLFLSISYVVSLFYTIPALSILLEIPNSSSIYILKAQRLILAVGFQRDISFSTLLNLSFLLLLYFNRNKLKTLTNIELTLVNMFLFYILLCIFCKEIKEVVDRLSYYFAFGLAFMFCLLPNLVPIKDIKKYILFVPCLYVFLKLGIHFRNEAAVYGLTPYRNVLFQKTYNESEILQRYYHMQEMAREDIFKKHN